MDPHMVGACECCRAAHHVWSHFLLSAVSKTAGRRQSRGRVEPYTFPVFRHLIRPAHVPQPIISRHPPVRAQTGYHRVSGPFASRAMGQCRLASVRVTTSVSVRLTRSHSEVVHLGFPTGYAHPFPRHSKCTLV
jgi:hypothetical protein